MLEDVADHPGRTHDVLVARLVPEGVVDHLQAVHIADHDGEILHRPLFDLGVVLLFSQEERMLALDAGHRIREGDGTGMVALLDGLLLPLFRGGVVDEQYQEGQSEKPEDDQAARAVHLVEPQALGFEELPFAHREGFAIRRAIQIIGNRLHDLVVPRLAHPLRPSHAHDDDEGQKGDPDDDSLAEPPRMVLPDNSVEIEQAEQRPNSHERIGLRLDGMVGENTREQEKREKYDQDDEADAAEEELLFASFLPSLLENRRRCETVDDDSADGGRVHDPADGRPAQEGGWQRYEKHEQDGVDRNLLLAELGEPLGKHVVLGDGIAQAADGAQHADQAGDHQRQ